MTTSTTMTGADRPHTAPTPPRRAATFTSSSQPADAAWLHARAPRRKSSAQSLSSSHSRSPAPAREPLDRRASTFSLSSIDELTSDLINPSFTRSTRHGEQQHSDDEVTNWHSTPLLFALLPAVGGVLFKEGAAVVTDLLILGLAAIFLNWSVRLPWDWYFAAQGIASAEAEEESVDAADAEGAVEETGNEQDAAGHRTPEDNERESEERANRSTAVSERREDAVRNLQTQESLALLSTFIFPAVAAYLLHVLRGQLSTSSTGLVSDYNLSIFLLVAEIRPCRHLIRLIRRRTLHLQRTANASDLSFGSPAKSSMMALAARIDELEDQFARQHKQSENGSLNGHLTKQSAVDELSVEMKKRYESRIDALERAVRRYEKRTTTLAMVTEQRLKTLDSRVESTLSLAAVAAQQSRQRSATAKALDSILAMVLLPLRMAVAVLMWPIRMLEDAYTKLMALLFGRPKASGSSKRGADSKSEKPRDRQSGRKIEGQR